MKKKNVSADDAFLFSSFIFHTHIYVQQLLAAHRTNTLRQPYMQTRSTRVCVCVHMYMYVCVCRCMLACACLWYNVILVLS